MKNYGMPSATILIMLLGVCITLNAIPATAETNSETRFDVVSANRFNLRDNKGNIRASLMLEDGHPAIVLVDLEGKPRGYFALYNGNPTFVMKDKQSNVRLSMSLGPEGDPRIKLGHKNSSYIFFLVDKGKEPTIFFIDKDRNPRLSLGIFDDQPSIGFWQKDKKVRMAMGLNKDQEPLLWLADQNGRPDLSLGRHQGKPQINLSRGQSSVALGMVQGDEPYIFVKHGGKVVWKATGTVVPDVSIPDELMRFERPKKSWQEQ